jgi:hypothetical protein
MHFVSLYNIPTAHGIIIVHFFCGAATQHGSWPPHSWGFSRSHTTTQHSRYDSSGRVISASQRPLPDNTQHSQQTFMPPVGFEPTILAGERTQIFALGRAVTGTGCNTTQYPQNIPLKRVCWKCNMFRRNQINTNKLSENNFIYFNILEAAQMKFLRHSLGITKLDKETNQCIRGKNRSTEYSKGKVFTARYGLGL